ncbi:YceI family protein [Pengzhenrongella sp.]|uniref:YceI family protein n=1 Tax=Pengzhenrongella sp. TaxID=2888820 RepID=UPI002F91F92B
MTTLTGGLRTQVRTTDGWALPHAVLTLTDMTGRQVLRQAADGDGAVQTGDLPFGPYTVIVTAIGYRPIALTAVVTAAGADLGTLVLTQTAATALPPPGPWTIDPVHSSVAAVAQHLGLSSVHGRFGDFSGQLQIAGNELDSSVHAVIEAASIDTGNATRDGHLRSADFLDSGANPRLAYRSTSLERAAPGRWTVHGELTMRAVTRPVDLDLTYLGTGPDPWGGMRAAFRATTELRRDDYAMSYNQIIQAGITAIGATLKVELDIQAVQGDHLPPT